MSSLGGRVIRCIGNAEMKDENNTIIWGILHDPFTFTSWVNKIPPAAIVATAKWGLSELENPLAHRLA